MDELDLTGKRIALYTRSKDILEGRSALLQAAVCEDFVAQRGGVIAHRFADVKSPGANLTLSGLAALQQACSAGEIDCIVVYRSDRIMRHRAQWSYLRAILDTGVEILCATENLALRRSPETA